MLLKHLKTILPAQDGAAKITAMTWSYNNVKLAVCTADRVVIMFDENGEKKDKFSTKPIDAKYGKKSYVVKGLAFSPDGTKLAIGQSDNIIFVYKIGEDWGEKKVICNKFVQSAAVTCLIWPLEGPIVFGLADGKVRGANVKSNKSQTLYQTESYVVSLSPNSSGTAFLSGHADGAVVRFYVSKDEEQLPQGKILQHNVPPYALCWANNHIGIGGCDRKFIFYTKEGRLGQQFDYARDDSEKELTTAICSPSGQSVVVGSFDRLRVFDWSPRRNIWEESKMKEIKNLYTITALAWKRDGSRVTCGSLCGSVELFDSALKRAVWNDRWEMTYVGPSQVLIKPLKGGGRGVILKSQYGYEIEDVKFMGKERYLVARTPETLLVGDLSRNLLSEVPWMDNSGNEKFFFENTNCCMIFNAGELSIIEYGNNELLGSVRTEFMNPHLISVRINERRQKGVEDNKKMAYLVDLKTITIIDLMYGVNLGVISHDTKIDWLELNETGHKLLFRDKRQRLQLVDIETKTNTVILNYCSFVQWVPGSDVVVAQSQTNLCIWYNIDAPERVTMFPIKGDIVDIDRSDNKTEVIVQDSRQEYSYTLDEGLIEFGTAIDDGDLLRAMTFLESLELTPEAEAMWRTLGRLAVDSQQLHIAERCYAALGDVSKAKYLREVIMLAEQVAQKMGHGDGMDFYEVRARMAVFSRQFKDAEAIYLDNNQVDSVIRMYQNMNKWDEALQVAETRRHPELPQLRANYHQWLMATRQEERAGELKEQEGDYIHAVQLYLRSGLPAKAARVTLNTPELANNVGLINAIAQALITAELFEKAGEMYQRVNELEPALDCFRRGSAYPRAVALARSNFPSVVVQLEEEWGDYLVSKREMDAAISHYIEAGKTIKALDAAVHARQWKKAMQIVQAAGGEQDISPYLLKLGNHFAQIGDHATAEKLFMDGGMFKEAIEMYNNAGKWDKAHYIARQHMAPEQVTQMYIHQAQELEESGKFRDAEKLYITVQEPDLAITMYKKQRQYDQMMRLVTEHHPELVNQTHVHLGGELENENNYKEAEKHYVAGGDWKAAVNMWRGLESWEDAFRVAKNSGGNNAAKQVAYLWARTMGGESAVKLLRKLGYLDQCIEYACESLQFDFAFELAKGSPPNKVQEIHYKHAMALEDDGKFPDAEEAFIRAGKPREAVLMYVHNQQWPSAQRVAENYDPDSVPDILVGQARQAFQEQNYSKFESLLLRAGRSEMAIGLYKEANMWQEALRVCREYAPHKLDELQEEYDKNVMKQTGTSTASGDVRMLLEQAAKWEQTDDVAKAIDCYMKINPSMTQDRAIVEKAWMKAAELAIKFLGSTKGPKLAAEMGKRLLEIGANSAAAQVFLGSDKVREAIEALVQASEWQKAKKIAQEMEPSYLKYVEEKYKEFLKTEGQADALASVDVIQGLDMFVQKGQWQKCIETAKQHGPQVLHKYLALYAAHLIKENMPVDALKLYVKHGAPAQSQNYNIYKYITVSMFGQHSLAKPESYKVWSELREFLFDLVGNMNHSAEAGSAVHEVFQTMLFVAHLLAARSAAYSVDQLTMVASKISVSLLRYTELVPADKAFFEAGVDAKKVGWDNLAFVCWNHFLDLVEAIEEGSLDTIDHSDFADTDVPFEIPLPPRANVDAAETERAKEWVLAVSMDQSVEQELPRDERGCYAASLLNPDGSRAPPCVVTGYPVLKNKMEFQYGKVANKDDWNSLVMTAKMTNSVELTDVLRFVGTWAGTGQQGFRL
ncbi:intraflagellar transport protein 172 homolog isoform X2 [Amphibalanus amphitrite]|uniref:intraflagellar transport protein 172 homolog isoform X2 n=1 Tax=Amphibalanus amphitrite TaxID=1232801 RepID=UPI001C9066B6|nr:intraflagellar transport protein 172 homolog isoform X2 [Amphibalanus amphitrite]